MLTVAPPFLPARTDARRRGARRRGRQEPAEPPVTLELPNLPNLKTTLESPAAAAAHGYTLDRGWAGWSPREKPNITLGLCLPNLGEGGWARLGSSTAISATSVLFTKVRAGIRPTPTFSVCKTTTYHTFMCACGRAGGLGREGCCCLREVRVSGAGGGWVGGRAWGACRGCPEGVWRACGGRGQQGVRCARLCVGLGRVVRVVVRVL